MKNSHRRDRVGLEDTPKENRIQWKRMSPYSLSLAFMASLSSWMPADTGRSAFLVAARTAAGLFSAASLKSFSFSEVFFELPYLAPRGLSFFNPDCCDSEASRVTDARVLVELEAAAAVRVVRVDGPPGGITADFKRVDARVGGVDAELTDLGGIEHLM